MKLVAARFIAILMLVIPGLLACFGFLKMKDSVFVYFSEFGNETITPDFEWLKFLLGFIMFAAGAGFIAGWTFFVTANGTTLLLGSSRNVLVRQSHKASFIQQS